MYCYYMYVVVQILRNDRIKQEIVLYTYTYRSFLKVYSPFPLPLPQGGGSLDETGDHTVESHPTDTKLHVYMYVGASHFALRTKCVLRTICR